MQVELISARELNDEQVRTWLQIQHANPALDSPFFCPRFTQTTAQVRSGIEVALLREGGQLRGFFPFERTISGAGKPVGAPFSEFHGVVAGRDLCWSATELLRACGLRCWDYDHVPLALDQFAGFHRQVGDSPCIHLDAGFEAYCEGKRRTGSHVMSRARRKARKLAREVGPVRFELHCGDDGVLERLFEWKTQQHLRTGVLDVFQFDWVRRFLRAVRDTQHPDFCGMMSALYAGQHVVAVHLGMRHREVAHLWYPAYDPRWADYSPGMSLFVELIRTLAEQGVRRIDLGPGPQRYKRSLQNGAIRMAIGTADRWPAAGWARRSWHQLRNSWHQAQITAPLRTPARRVLGLRHWLAMK